MTDKKTFMRMALEGQKRFGAPAPIVPFADWHFYYTAADLEWRADGALSEGLMSVRVPAGFVTDLASIPRVFWSVLPPAAAYAYAAVVHDYLYWFQPCARAHADNVLRAGMIELRVSRSKVLVIYKAVRYAGWLAWRANCAARENGEKRLLARFPREVTTSWADWKLQSDVFALGDVDQQPRELL
jgi:hypothetical protein